ncbi:Tyrosine-protein kinase YwqD [Planctomycetes bacterium CA13]|uniref:Tyrosine-protein kinase YwqD n=1 Tax=Novipirellula herctigrandis TaxID=2527986 RepID=A0A5C5Z1A3_9BACT|nr:Tyrosine-protein kinase YwqD [Planctomycetes bacterium CA13]
MTASNSGASTQFDPWILWVTFRRCWFWVLPIGAVLAALASFGVLSTFVPTYRANALLQANQDWIVFKGVMPTLTDLARTEKSLFFNPIVIDPVLADPDLRRAPSLSDPDTAEVNLRKNLKISSDGTPTQLLVSYEDTDREAAANVCNAVVESYLRQRDDFDNIRVSNLGRWLEPEIQRWEQEVEERRQSVNRLSQQTLGYAPGRATSVAENNDNMSLLAKLRADIADLTVELSIADAQLAMKGEAQSAMVLDVNSTFVPPIIKVQRREPTEDDIAKIVQRKPEVVNARERIRRYEGMILNMEDTDLVRINRSYYDELKAKKNESEKKLQAAMDAARQQALVEVQKLADEDFKLQEEEAKTKIELARREFEQGLKLASLDHQSEGRIAMEAEKQQRDGLETRLQMIEKQYDAERTRLEQFGGTTAELQFAQEQLDVANEVLIQLRSRDAAIKTERRQDGAVRTLAAATPPKTPVEEIPVKKMAVAGLAAMMIPFLIGLLWELRVQRVTDSSMCDGLIVVGEVAKLPAGPRSSRGRRVFEESIDSLRANLFLSKQWEGTRSIAVASSVSGEGKSSVASQLAISIAKATGETVLLVDADVRCPDQHRLFGLDMGAGLSGVLSGQTTLTEAIDTSLGDLIHVLPAGKLTTSPHRMLNPKAMKAFISDAMEKYTYVVVDTSPVLSAGETLAIASAVESTLMCMMRDVSRMDSVRLATRRLEAAGANMVGTVFSGVTAQQYAYRYGDYHYVMPDFNTPS